MSKHIKINDFSDWVDDSPESKLAPSYKHAVAMIRVSTKQQKSDAHFSDQEQRAIIEKYVRANNIELAREPWDIAETASKHSKRHGFNAMMEFVEQSQKTDCPIKHVVFSHQSRCARNNQSARMIEALVYDYDVVIHFARENRKFDAHADLGELLSWVLENVKNAAFIAEHTKNVKGGMKRKLENGGYCGLAPYGYINHRATPKAPSVFQFDGEKADYVRTAFELCASGLYTSVQQLLPQLDKCFSHLRNPPRKAQLYRILRNPFYYGGFRWNGNTYQGSSEYHTSLISRQIWERVQEILDGRARYKVSDKNFRYLKMLKCGGILLDEHGAETGHPCGCSVTAEQKHKGLKNGTTKTYHYYRCSRNKPDGRCSQRDTNHLRVIGRTVSYAESEIESLFQAVFKPFNWTTELVGRMQEILRAEHAQKSCDHKAQVSSLRRRYEMLQTYMDKAYDDKLAGDLAPDQWREKNERWKREREETHQKIMSLDGAKDEYIENGVLLIELAQHTEKFYKIATPEQKRQLVEIVSSNHVLKDGSIGFSYRKPFDLLAETASEEKWWSR